MCTIYIKGAPTLAECMFDENDKCTVSFKLNYLNLSFLSWVPVCADKDEWPAVVSIGSLLHSQDVMGRR